MNDFIAFHTKEGRAENLVKNLTAEQIQFLVAAFADGARRALEAGGKILEIHAAHGYLLHEFLSALSNRRADNYGGTFENRIRIVRRVVEAVRNVPAGALSTFRAAIRDGLD